jgi:hypothetical protein
MSGASFENLANDARKAKQQADTNPEEKKMLDEVEQKAAQKAGKKPGGSGEPSIPSGL